MNLLFKILKIAAVILIAIVAILFSASLLMQDSVAGIILRSLNKNLTTKYEFGSLHLSFLKKFPKASLDLKDAWVRSSPGFDTTCFRGINTDTLLSAKSVSFEFSISDIIRGVYNIDRVGVKDGHLNIFTDTAGNVNYEIAVENTGNTSEEITINLDRINVADVKADYNNQATELIIEGMIQTGQLKSRITGDEIDFIANSMIRIDLFRLYNTSVSQSITTDLDLNLHSSDSGVFFRKGVLKIENFSFDLKGFVSHDDVLDLYLNGENIDLSKLKKYVPDKYTDLVRDYDPSGILKVTGMIKGPVTRTTNPLTEFFFDVNKGHIDYGRSQLNINDISFTGYYTNGEQQKPETNLVSVRDLKARIGSSEYSAALLISNFIQPNADISLKGIVKPAEIREFFNLHVVSAASGTADLDLRLTGILQKKDKYSITDFFGLNPEGTMLFHSFGLELKDRNFDLNRVTGKLIMAESIITENLNFTFRDHNLTVNGEFFNLPEWIAGKRAIMRAKADVTCGRLVPAKLFPSTGASAASASGRTAFNLPGNIILDLRFDVDSLSYKTLTTGKIRGILSYGPRVLNLKSLNINTLNGTISGNGLFAQNTDKSLVARGSFNLENIDINSAFITFRNFGQDFIK
ncbi:MAG: hypothetical protein IQL11_13160, partial [Bacteroidales bacterium]|nr:hypothetical protein [Bacteroidales bacterium]